ncbi:helicase C-terminal domain-containing protein [Spongiactinospora sp. TRM90649]|nr:helicase C-terminal domain-containing protein [Spongiactinospora sp. TRM90649]MDF5757819.1 helicase C-terminal domain-containing protein [Spongiactinospora sp. TRM90649]
MPVSADFADWLRGRDDEELRALVTARPELVTPVPAHIAGLASRATTPSAVGRAIDRLDRFALAVLETLVLLPPPVHQRELRTLMRRAAGGARGAFEEALNGTLRRLRELALVYGPETAPAPAPGVREALDPPAGLGPPAVVVFRDYAPERLGEIAHDVGAGPGERVPDLLGVPGVVERLVEEVSPQARAALDELAWGPATGRLANARRPARTATAQSPIEELLARGLLGATGDETVTLPREVALYLRGGRFHRDLLPGAPALRGPERTAGLAERTAAGQAFAFIRVVEDLCERWSVEPPGVLRTGGLAVRDLKRAALSLDLPEWSAALVVEVAFAAGLIVAAGGVDGEWLPSALYDAWRIKPGEERWAALAGSWLTMDRVPGLAGERDDRDRLMNALTPELRRGAAHEVRAATLAVLASSAHDVAPDAASVRERLAWEQPRRRGPYRDRLIDFTLREAEQLGVTGLGVLSAHGRALADGDSGAATKLLAPLLPQPVDHVLLQADLTAVAPGPLTGDLRRWLALAADVESTGGATVYRFGEGSVRRALDAGHGAEELLAVLARHSATPVPQPLTYLISDVARRHGRIRVGSAGAYIRCDDPSVLDQVMADRRALPLRLRRLAPTVIASRSARAALVDGLRAMGYAPVAESLDGDVIVSRPDARRAEGQPARAATVVNGLDRDVVAAAVRAIRAGDAAHQARRPAVESPEGEVPRSPATATINTLQQAIRQGGRVWIGYLDNQGHATSRILEPARMEGGYLTAYDETRAAVHRFALHRITGVSDVTDSSDTG